MSVDTVATGAPDSSMHDRIHALVEEYNDRVEETGNGVRIPEDQVKLPSMFLSPSKDTFGNLYVTDVNNVVKYYVELGVLAVTDDFCSSAQLVVSADRALVLEDLLR